jgi:F-type H+-transporting ATPase subunit b
MIGTSVFLLPNGTFVVELVALVIILFLMTKYILPPLNKAMESRQEKIRTSLMVAPRST